MSDATKPKLRGTGCFDNEFKTQEIAHGTGGGCKGAECSLINGETVVQSCSVNSDTVVCSNGIYGAERCMENYGTFPEDTTPVEEHKPSAVRYLMLLLFSLSTMMNGFQWIQYSVITSIIMCYYDVSVTAVNWTSVLFMLMYIPFNFPVIHLMNNKGLRYTLILGAAGNCLTWKWSWLSHSFSSCEQ